MKYISLLFLPLMLASLACLQTTTQAAQAPAYTATPESTLETAMRDTEPASGEVYEVPATSTPRVLCVTADMLHLRTEPSHKAIVIDWLPALTEVIVLHTGVDGWSLVTAGTQTGYVKAEYLGGCHD